jgi:hypothetical protein
MGKRRTVQPLQFALRNQTPGQHQSPVQPRRIDARLLFVKPYKSDQRFCCLRPFDCQTHRLRISLYFCDLVIMPLILQHKQWIVQKYGGTSLGKLLPTITGTIIPHYLETHNVAVVFSATSGTSTSLGAASLLIKAIDMP